MKTNQAKNLKMTGQTAVTFPGIGSIAEARSVSRPGEARRCAGMRLDTDLSDLGTQLPFIRGMSRHFHLPAKPMRRQIYDATRDIMLL